MTDEKTPTKEKEPETRLKFNVIMTYEQKDQEVFDVTMLPDIPEQAFVATLLHEAGWDMATLVKISTCMTGVHQAGKNIAEGIDKYYPEYLKARSGKYYFNADTNKDPDTKQWSDFRDGYYMAMKMMTALRE